MATPNATVINAIPSAEGPLASRGTVRTLVVDDTPAMLELLATVLHSDPHIEVIGTANNGLAAVAFAAAHNPDLVLMDVNMPTMNGLKAAMHIKKRLPEIKVILMSSDDDPRLAFAAMDCGADGFIPKYGWRSYRWHVKRLFFR